MPLSYESPFKYISRTDLIHMKAAVGRSGCISCGLCAETCLEAFRMGDDGPAEVHQENVPKDVEIKPSRY